MAAADTTMPRPARMPRPVIGITALVEPASWSSWRDVPAVVTPFAYVRHIMRAGGCAVVIPPLPAGATVQDACDVVRRLDGLIISGGVDVESSRYGEPPHPQAQPPRADRDASELVLARASASENVPLLGVCRGMQVMAVAAGGSLEQHLPDRLGSTRHAPGVGFYGSHVVTIADGSLLAEIVGAEVTVATYHHQGVVSAPGYRLCAWAEDGVLEGMEDPAADFRIGVQWHPEAGEDPRLFERLVAAARHRTERGAEI